MHPDAGRDSEQSWHHQEAKELFEPAGNTAGGGDSLNNLSVITQLNLILLPRSYLANLLHTQSPRNQLEVPI